MTSYCQYTPDKKEQSTQNQTKICAIIVFYVYFVLYIELLFGDVGLNGSLGNLKVLTCASFEALDAELSNMSTNTPYIAVIPGGDGMLFGLKNHSDYQRQIRITYWDNALYSRVKTNSTQWSEWVKLNDIKSSHEIKLDTGIYFGYFGYAAV